MRKVIGTLILLLLAANGNAQSFELAGDWEGYIKIQGRQLSIKTHFQKKEAGLNGTIDIPPQGVMGLHLYDIKVTEDDSVFFAFGAAPQTARFKGTFENDSTITGAYFQVGKQLSFRLVRVEAKNVAANKNISLPYHHKNLIIKNDSLKIGGTLTWPEEKPTDQLVITLSGSGAQNRDEEIFGFKIFGTIADYLTRNGIAVFNFDDRGIGESSGSLVNATLEMLAGDVGAITRYFSQKHDTIPAFSNIIVLGHSKGGLVGGIAAAENKKIDKLILMSSPGLPMSEILAYQYSRKIKNGPLTDEQKQNQIAAIKKMLMAVANDKDVNKAKENYNNQLLAYMKMLPDSVQASIRSEVNSSDLKAAAKKITEVRLRIAEFAKRTAMLNYNPAVDLRKLDIPVLVLFGGKDVQVTVEMNKEPIKQALEEAGVPYKIKIFPDANHLYQETKSKDAAYSALKDEFVDGFLKTVAEWIKH